MTDTIAAGATTATGTGSPVEIPLPVTLPTADEVATLPAGFHATGAAIGIKRSGRPDFAVVATTAGPASAAAVFTRNGFAAAPVRLSRAHLAETAPEGAGGYGLAEALIATSGSANAATGAPGDADQGHIAAALATALGTVPSRTLAMSTGLIGTRLPVDLVTAQIAARIPATLVAADRAFGDVARGLMTTDSRPKWATTRTNLPGPGGGVPVTVSGVAKGVGMIHPGMATMLAIVLTDAALDPATLHGLLRPAAARTWNQLSVDGDTSTNDTVIALASGAAGNAPVVPGSAAAAALGAAIESVARSLARQQAADGEGATVLLTAQVSGATDDADARAVARAVVASSLVKAAVHGKDPNWGRIAGAAGNARLPEAALLEAAGFAPSVANDRAGRAALVAPERMRIAIAGQVVYAGQPLAFDREAARAAMDAPEILVRLDLGLGDGTGEAFGCDLTEAYVRENSEYST